MLNQCTNQLGDNTRYETDATFLDIDESHKKKKRIFKRSSGFDSERSNESKRVIKTTRVSQFIPDFKPILRKPTTSFINFSSVELKCKSDKKQVTQRQSINCLRNNTFIKNICVDINSNELTENIKPARVSQMNYSIFKKFEYLSQELAVRNQQIDLIEGERQKIKLQHKELQQKYKLLEDSNKKLTEEIQKNKAQVKNMQHQKRRWESQKTIILKRMESLEKIRFNSDTKNLQSFREQHLQKQLAECKEKLRAKKTDQQHMLQSQLSTIKEQLFNARKFIQSLQINNKCLQMKLNQKQNSLMITEQYEALRTKYKKFLAQFKDLRRQHQQLIKSHKDLQSQLDNQKQHNDGDVSLDFSLLF